MQLLCFSIALLPKKEKTTPPWKSTLLHPSLSGRGTDFLKRVVDWCGVSGWSAARNAKLVHANLPLQLLYIHVTVLKCQGEKRVEGFSVQCSGFSFYVSYS